MLGKALVWKKTINWFTGRRPELEEEHVLFTDREISLVQSTWAPIALQPDVAAEAFYSRLFEVAPGVRPLFPEDMKAQGRKLIQMIGVAVNNADDVESLIPALRALGERHVGYGAVA